jgi:diguanylate cyclase (GGDEF)-like protein
MLPLDVLSSFAICGAGALVGAALLRPSLAHDESSAEVLRISRGAYALIGVGLTQLVLQPLPLPPWSQASGAYATVGGLATMAWALAALSGRIVSRALLWPTLAGLLLVLLALLPMGTRGLTWFVTWGVAAASLLVLGLGHRLVWRPRDLNERLAGIVMLLTAGTSALRASYLFTWNGPYESHLLHMPPPLVVPFALMYGVLPILFAMLLLNVLNARLQARLHQRAMTDALTGALSRLALAEGAAALIERLRASGQRLAVVMVDLDHFKQVNDRFGHTSGDAVLRQAAERLLAQLRPEALLARYGGEEFVALVPVDDLPVARRVAERLRTALGETPWDALVPGLQAVTASLGVTLLEPGETLERALARADEALYRAKNGGRNQVQVGLAAA